jgi:hypothetical protein
VVPGKGSSRVGDETERLQEIIFGLLDAPADVRERMKSALTPKDKPDTEPSPP